MGRDRPSFEVVGITVEPSAAEQGGDGSRLSISGEFSIMDIVGKGGMGEVRAAQDKRLLRTVALKSLSAKSRQDPEARARFCVEAQVGAQLEHPNIVPIYGMEESRSGNLAFTMRMIEGRTFRMYLAKCRAAEDAGRVERGEYSLKSRLAHIATICDALQYAHDRGVVHRDIKPGNILLGKHHELYVVDWGIARVESAPEYDVFASMNTVLRMRKETVSVSDSGLTSTGSVLGTPRYMAPEQAAADIEEHGPATDQFLVGMLLHEAVTLRHPRSGSHGEVFEAAIGGLRAPLEPYQGGSVEPRLRAIIDKATAFRPTDRYDRIDTLAADIRALIRDEEVSVLPDGPFRRVWRALSRRREVVLSVGLAMTVLILGALVWSLTRTMAVEREAREVSLARAVLTTTVMQRGDEIEAVLTHARRILARVVAIAQETVDHPVTTDERWYTDTQLASGEGPELYFDTRYGQPITWETASVTFAYNADMDAARQRATTLSRLSRALRIAMLRAYDVNAPSLPHAEQEALLRTDGPLLYTAAAFEEGLMLDMPGYSIIPERYDPRVRPWYRHGVAADELTWAPAYSESGSGRFLVPCYGPLRGEDGRVVGVAGGDMSMDGLIELLRLPDVPGFRIARILDSEGNVLIDSREEGMLNNADRTAAQTSRRNEPVEDEALRAAIRRNEDGGQLDRGETTIVFDHFTEIDWTLAVWIDTDSYLRAYRGHRTP